MSDKNKLVQKYIKGMQKHTRKQELRDARRKAGVRTDIRKPRLKKITPNDWDEWDDLDEMEFATYQPILSKDERERRREIDKALSENTNGKTNSAADSHRQASSPNAITGTTALVVETSSGMCRVDLNGEIILCDIRGNVKDAITGYVNPVAVGDQVLITKNGSNHGVVEAVLPRRSVLARPYAPNVGKIIEDLEQIVVANVDRLLIVTSWREPYIWPALIDRYLIAAQRNQIEAWICINKMDLVEDQGEFEATIKPYQDLRYQLLFTSTVTGQGIDQVHALLQDVQLLFVSHNAMLL